MENRKDLTEEFFRIIVDFVYEELLHQYVNQKGIYGKLEKKTLHKCYISNLLNLLSKYNLTREIGYLIEIQKVLFDENSKISMPFLTHTIDDLRNLCTKMMTSLACRNSNDLSFETDFTYQDFYKDVCVVLTNSKNISYDKRFKYIHSKSISTESSEIFEKTNDDEPRKSIKRNVRSTIDDENIIEPVNKKKKGEKNEVNKRYILCDTEKHLPISQGSCIANLYNNNFERYSQLKKTNFADIPQDLTACNMNEYSRNSHSLWDEKEVTYLIFFVNKLGKLISFPYLFEEISTKYGQYFNNRKAADLKIKYEKLLNEEKTLFDYFKIKAKILEEEVEISEFTSSNTNNLVNKWCKTEIAHLVFFVGKLGNCWYDISTKHKKYFRNRSAFELKNKYYNLRETESIFEYFKKKAELLDGKKLIELISVDKTPEQQHYIYSDTENKIIESNEIFKFNKEASLQKVQRSFSASRITAEEGYISNEFWQSFAYPFITDIHAIENINVL